MSFLRGVLALLLIVLMGAAPTVHAQSLSASAAEAITITINPQYPRPYDTITISPRSSLIDLAAHTVRISVNGEVIEEGSGSRSVTAKVGGPGSRTVVRVTATDSAGESYAAEVTLRPADIALIIEPVSTVPPFYKGASLVAPEGRVRLVAIPDFRTTAGAMIPSSSLVYTWKNGDRILQEQSGIGRSVLDAVAPLRYRDATITVTVSTQDRSVTGSAVANVSPVDPFVRIYRTSPLMGPSFEREVIGSATMNGTEDTFRVVPYYFREFPEIAWTVNSVGGETDDTLTVRITEPGQGTARIGVTARTPGALQSAERAFGLQFGTSRTGIFGF